VNTHRLMLTPSLSRRLAGAGLTLLLASSCALPQTGRSVSRARASAATHAHHRVETDAAKSTAAQSPEAASPAGEIQQLSHQQNTLASGEVKEWPALPPQQVHPFAPPTVQAQHSFPDPLSPHSYRNEPRIDLPSESLSLQNCPMPWETTTQVPVPVCEPQIWADEYLCDGGDRGLPVHYHGREMAGLDTEDTVAEFTNHLGEKHVKPSTQVCIYAPQFASVRSSTMPELGLQIDRAAGAHDGRSTAGLNSRNIAHLEQQNDQAVGIDVRSRVSGLDRQLSTDAMSQVAAVVNHVKLINLFEDRAFFRRAQLDQTQELYLAYGLQSAIEWTRDQNPVIVAVDAGGQEVTANFKVEEYIGLDEKCPGDLKIIKLADKHVAHPGDIVTFTIHFDNVGERELTSVRIIDNLTPRLQFIEGSADSDREGRLDVEDNGEGSLVLTFELAGPLPGKTGGTVTFQTRVR
jgi:uncharacterized repeat protein (TIGR01451 family)